MISKEEKIFKILSICVNGITIIFIVSNYILMGHLSSVARYEYSFWKRLDVPDALEMFKNQFYIFCFVSCMLVLMILGLQIGVRKLKSSDRLLFTMGSCLVTVVIILLIDMLWIVTFTIWTYVL